MQEWRTHSCTSKWAVYMGHIHVRSGRFTPNAASNCASTHARTSDVCKLAQSATQTHACTPSPHTVTCTRCMRNGDARCIVHGTAAARKRNIVTHRVGHRHAVTRHTGVLHASSKRFRCTNMAWSAAVVQSARKDQIS
jgi:hypothetical protein